MAIMARGRMQRQSVNIARHETLVQESFYEITDQQGWALGEQALAAFNRELATRK
jgi:hypothetical protein